MKYTSTKINFNQPKYIIGVISYFGVLLCGALFFWVFDTDLGDTKSSNLKTTEYLNADLPEAHVKDGIGSKRENVTEIYGNLKDYTGVDNINDDRDSLQKKEDYDSKYSEEELKRIQEQEAQRAEIERLRKQNAQLQEASRNNQYKGSQMSSNGYQLPLSDSDRARLNEMRRRGQIDEISAALGKKRSDAQQRVSQDIVADSLRRVSQSNGGNPSTSSKAVKEVDKEKQPSLVVKKSNESAKYFHTISENVNESSLITAIIDEEIKVVDGSRVRLRVLDDLEIDGKTVKKGTYMYANMSGFSKQRIQGTVTSVMIGSEIHKINLSIYDTDGLEGLYVPESSFRETARDVASSAMSSNMDMSTSSGNSMLQWAQQGVQQAYQRTSQAISKALKKNKVRIKYGTRVYLINSKEQKSKQQAAQEQQKQLQEQLKQLRQSN